MLYKPFLKETIFTAVVESSASIGYNLNQPYKLRGYVKVDFFKVDKRF